MIRQEVRLELWCYESSLNMNEVQQSDSRIENVRVVVRVRPFSKKEKTQKCQSAVNLDLNNTIVLSKNDAKKLQTKTFQFDYVFDQQCSQLSIYQKVAQPIIQQIFQGYNGTIFAYGQTGSGKTYTMSGIQNEIEQGIIPNTFSHIFSKISSESGEKSFVVTATYLEIYNEEIRDLLSSNSNKKLELRERLEVGVYVKGLTSYTIDCIESINKLISVSNSNRKTRSTLMNEVSSRSHALFSITIEARDKNTNKTTIAKLNLVDLAGSERLKRTQATGDCLKEATNINQSLFVLSNVISALVEEKSNHIPYRNSKLTRLLQDSLGGNSKTAMIATISPCSTDYEESLGTLRYASRAKLIRNHVHLNIQTDKGLIGKFEDEIMQLQKHLALILEKEESSKINKVSSEKPNNHKQEVLNIENTKRDLNDKIKKIQNKILIGQNLYDKEQEQKFLLETSYEELQKLDKFQQELEELLEEKEGKRFDLEEQYGSLQEEDQGLDEKIQKLEFAITKVAKNFNEKQQDQQAELTLLLENNCNLTSELQKINNIIKYAIPKMQRKKIEGNVVWNDETCDFELKGIAHVGNYIKPKRRFRKHIPTSALMCNLINERKNMARRKKRLTVESELEKKYLQYPQIEYDTFFSDEEDFSEASEES
ncbi:hypothetical protein FQA39_LY05663 [Lamprigera yunnana]|nr:hypothetical protein FQA39_LY05663 [Lamprigera yunnana]